MTYTPKFKLRCPFCGDHLALCRVEALLAYADITVNDDEHTFEYAGESDLLWDTQSRDLLSNTIDKTKVKSTCEGADPSAIPEFYCNHCNDGFNYDADFGFIDINGDTITPKEKA
jgi:hypothetical protein